MNSTNRSRAKAGSTGFALVLAFASFAPLCAQTIASNTTYWFAGTQLLFERPQVRSGGLAISTSDDGLARFMGKVGATLSYQPGQKYIVVTDARRRSIAFTLGDPHYTVGGVVETAAFAPYAVGDVAFLPFLDLARALYVDPVPDASGVVVLQPEIAALDVRTENAVTLVTLHGASALRFKRLSKPGDDTVSLAFSGTGSTLEAERAVNDTSLRDVSIAVSGSPKNPTATFTFAASPGGIHVLVPNDAPNSVTLAFAAAGTQVSGTPIPRSGESAGANAPLVASSAAAAYGNNETTAIGANGVIPPANAVAPAYPATPSYPGASGNPGAPLAEPAPLATQTPTAEGLSPASITALDTQSVDDGFNIKLAIAGPVTYEWHRLTDDRWYVDFKPANLAIPEEEQPLSDPSIVSLRVKPFVGPVDHLATVRVAFTMPSPRAVDIVATPDGMMIEISGQDDAGVQTAGTGELVDGRLASAVVPLPVVAAAPAPAPGEATDPSWKFSPGTGAKNPKLIIIDPGHGGSDTGAAHNGLVEAYLNLDVSRRLRAILISRGWEVKMTRNSDVDVYQPNDSARDELQARDDIANNAGGRLLVSVHTNSFTTSELNGTTTYYYTASSRGLAQAVHARLASLPTADDGIRKENFYVIHHQNMPGILVEMAFLSNPSDAKLLSTSTFLQSVATAIADGIGDYTSGPGQSVSSDSIDPNNPVDGN